MALSFIWDPAKAAANLRKHGVSFPEATTAFDDPHSLTVRDPDHSNSEDRLVLLGTATHGRLLVVAHTERGDAIRIISARKAARRERKIYEEES
jgi:uncharacterized DUF497 family protein